MGFTGVKFHPLGVIASFSQVGAQPCEFRGGFRIGWNQGGIGEQKPMDTSISAGVCRYYVTIEVNQM